MKYLARITYNIIHGTNIVFILFRKLNVLVHEVNILEEIFFFQESII